MRIYLHFDVAHIIMTQQQRVNALYDVGASDYEAQDGPRLPQTNSTHGRRIYLRFFLLMRLHRRALDLGAGTGCFHDFWPNTDMP